MNRGLPPFPAFHLYGGLECADMMTNNRAKDQSGK